MERNQTNKSTTLSLTLRVLFAIAMLGLTLSFLRNSADMLNGLILAWVIVLVASPLLHWLLNKGIPTWLSFTLTLLAILVVLIIFVLLMVIAVELLVEALPDYSTQFESMMTSVQDSMTVLGIDSFDLEALSRYINPTGVVDFAAEFLTGLIGTVSNMVFVALLVIFMMLDALNVPAKLLKEVHAGNNYLKRFFNTSQTVRNYVYITTIVGLVTGAFDTILFIILGVDFAVLWGVLAFLLSYIPSLGFWLAAIPPTILALLESGPGVAALTFLGIVLINGFAENVIKPKYMGKGLNLSPFIVIFSVIFWAAILGPLGAILGVPMTVLFKELVLEADVQNRWIANLMSSSSKNGTDNQPDETTGLADINQS